MSLTVEQKREADRAFRALRAREIRGLPPKTEEERAALITLSVLTSEGRTGVVDVVREVICRKKPATTTVEGSVAIFCVNNGVTVNTAYRWIRMAKETYRAVRYPDSGIES